MSAMSDIDVMLTAYEDAREEYKSVRSAMLATAGTAILGHVQPAEEVIRAADTLAAGLRSILGANRVEERQVGGFSYQGD